MKNFAIVLCLLSIGCANQVAMKEGERKISSQDMIVHSPKDVGYIYIGRTGRTRWDMNNLNYILEQDLGKEDISDSNGYPIGDRVLKPGTVVKIQKETIFYTKPSFWVGGRNKDDSYSIKAGTKVRILSYDRESLSLGATNAIVEIVD